MSTPSSPSMSPEPPKTSSSTRKSTKVRNGYRVSKRSTSQTTAPVVPERHKRVWKACERCRTKKTKCDGNSPCKRCKDDNIVCQAGTRKKTELRQMPQGYAEVLENTTVSLAAAVQKLYRMLQNNNAWDLDEPSFNDKGEPAVHDIAQMLGCIRRNNGMPDAFPETAEDLESLRSDLQIAEDSADIPTPKSSGDSNNAKSPSPMIRHRRDSTGSEISNTTSEISIPNAVQTLRQSLQVKPEPNMQDTYMTSIAPSQTPIAILSTGYNSNDGFTSTPTSIFPQQSGSFNAYPTRAEDPSSYLSQQLFLNTQQINPNNMMAARLQTWDFNGAGFGDGTIQPAMLEGGGAPMFGIEMEYGFYDQMVARS